MSDLDTIAKQVEADRARLAGSLNALSATIKPQSVAQDLSNAVDKFGGGLAQKALKNTNRNPAGALLVIVGLGLLAAGPENRARPAADPDPVDPGPPVGFDARVAQADAAMRADAPDASRLRRALTSGLDQLPPSARERVLKARKAALTAQERIERQARRKTRQTKGFIAEKPLTAGALAFGFGLLTATLLPGTRREDALLGQTRDTLMAEARHALEEEMAKVRNRAEEVLADTTGTSAHDLRG